VYRFTVFVPKLKIIEEKELQNTVEDYTIKIEIAQNMCPWGY